MSLACAAARCGGVAGLVDNRRHHRHKGEKQQAEIDGDEADELPAHLLDRRVERLFFLVVECGPYQEHFRSWVDERS